MSREEKAIFTNLCMVYHGKGNLLVQNQILFYKTCPIPAAQILRRGIGFLDSP